MKRNEIKIEFTKDYSVYKKGDSAIFKLSLASEIIKEGVAKVFKATKKK